MSEWQPIETAPKSGISILGYSPGSYAVVEWFEAGRYWSLVECGSYAEDDEWTPTHWMPLPPPPKEPEYTPDTLPSKSEH